VDVAGELLEEDIEVRFLPLHSPEAKALGAELAPALVVNRRTLVEGVPSTEEIRALVQKTRPITLGVLLTKAPEGSEDAQNALLAAKEALAAGHQAALFLLSDGVWAAKKGQQGPLAQGLADLLQNGGRVYASGEHLKASGLTPEKLVEGVAVADDAFGCLVDLIMDEWDKVIVF
jgi:sulfur relay (sulfurtransferase) DsrF/TusC family protein